MLEPISEALKAICPEHSEHGFKKRTEKEEAEYQAYLDNNTPGDLDDGVDCQVCMNRGFVTHVRYDERFQRHYPVAVMCVCQKTRAAKRRLKRSGLEKALQEKTFESYETPDARRKRVKEAAMRFAREGGDGWFFIGGQSGAGKSHLCTAIAGELLKQGKDVRYMLWRDEITHIKAVVNEHEEYAPLIDGLKKVDVLYIDDLFKMGKDDKGTVKLPTAGDINAAFEILNYRYNNPGLITIISSERTLGDLNEIDEAIAGRIAERSRPGGFLLNLKKDPEWNWRMRGLGEI